MTYTVPQLEPYVDEHELDNLKEVIKNKWLTEGPFSKKFLQQIKDFTGARHVVLAPNGTLAIYLSLLALGIHKGDEVIVPDFTFNATASPIVFTGADPVFVDIQDSDLNIDPNLIEAAITSKTKAIIPVHIYGQSVDMNPILKIARDNNLKVLEDAAESYGVFHYRFHTGTIGDLGIISFFADKTLTCLSPETRITIRRSPEGRGKSHTRRIDEIKIGDEILSYDEKKGIKEFDKVIKIYTRNVTELKLLKLSNGNEIKITDNHPIFIIGKGWVSVSKVQINDKVMQYKYHGLQARKNSISQQGETFEERIGKEEAKKWGEKHSEQIKAKHRDSNSNYSKMYTDKWREKIRTANKGRIVPDEEKNKMKKGQLERWKNMPKEEREAFCNKMKEITSRPEIREKRRKKSLELARNPEYIAKVSRGVREAMKKESYWVNYAKGQNLKPNKQEQKLDAILTNICPNEFAYNGDFRLKIVIDNFIPDFVNIAGKQKIIELFGSYWHTPPEEQEKINRYKAKGYDCLIIWDNELKDIQTVEDKIETFVYNPDVELPKIIDIQKIEGEQKVYNIETEKNHNYFAYGILVHNCGEGAVVLTDDDQLDFNLKNLRNQGRLQSGSFKHPLMGMNFRVTDLQCAVGVAQLDKFEEIKRLKLNHYNLYKELLKDADVRFLEEKPYSNIIPFRVVIRVKDKQKVMKHLEDNKIQTRGVFYPLHRQPCFEYLKYDYDAFPVSNKAFDEGICLPVYPGLKDWQIEYICEKIKEVV